MQSGGRGGSFWSLALAAAAAAGLGSAAGAASADATAELVAPGATVEKLADGFKFTEGPARDAAGDVYFTDIPNNRIHRWKLETRELGTFREDTGGANGLVFDRAGNLYAAEGGNRRITRIAPDGTLAVLADQYGGKKLNSPNDLWVDAKGGVYFTDPRYGDATGVEQDGMHVYYVTPDRERVVRVTHDLVKPNGVVGTADGKRLYVADAGAGHSYSYAIQADGTLADRKLAAADGSDGMKLDEKGNLYLTTDAVVVYSPAGEKIARIEVPERPSNLVFAGKDGRTLFITARTGIYAIRMQVKGQ
jgi:gluconolactonase